MARDFSKVAGTNYLSIGVNDIPTACNGAGAVSFHALVYADTLTGTSSANNRIFSAYINSGGGNAFILAVGWDGSNYVVRVGGRSEATDGFQGHSGNTTITTSSSWWVGGVLDYANDEIRVYVDGQPDGTLTGVTGWGRSTFLTGSPTVKDVIGCDDETPTSPTNKWEGGIEHLAVWKGDIGDGGFASLVKNVSPKLISPQYLVSHWELTGDDPERETINGFEGTVTGTDFGARSTPSVPPLIQPSSQILQFPPAAAASSVFPILRSTIIKSAML